MTYDEMKAKRAELLKKADNAQKMSDPFNSGAGAIYARQYKQEAKAIFREMCKQKGIDPAEVM